MSATDEALDFHRAIHSVVQGYGRMLEGFARENAKLRAEISQRDKALEARVLELNQALARESEERRARLEAEKRAECERAEEHEVR